MSDLDSPSGALSPREPNATEGFWPDFDTATFNPFTSSDLETISNTDCSLAPLSKEFDHSISGQPSALEELWPGSNTDAFTLSNQEAWANVDCSFDLPRTVDHSVSEEPSAIERLWPELNTHKFLTLSNLAVQNEMSCSLHSWCRENCLSGQMGTTATGSCLDPNSPQEASDVAPSTEVVNPIPEQPQTVRESSMTVPKNLEKLMKRGWKRREESYYGAIRSFQDFAQLGIAAHLNTITTTRPDPKAFNIVRDGAVFILKLNKTRAPRTVDGLSWKRVREFSSGSRKLNTITYYHQKVIGQMPQEPLIRKIFRYEVGGSRYSMVAYSSRDDNGQKIDLPRPGLQFQLPVEGIPCFKDLCFIYDEDPPQSPPPQSPPPQSHNEGSSKSESMTKKGIKFSNDNGTMFDEAHG